MKKLCFLLIGIQIILAQNVGIGIAVPTARLHIFVPNGWSSHLLRVEEDLIGYPYLVVEAGGNVGIGTDNPRELLELVGDSDADLDMTSFGNDVSTIHMRRARGTRIFLEAVKNGDDVGAVEGLGYDGAQYVRVGGIDFIVDGNVSSGSVPGAIIFRTREEGSTNWGGSARMIIRNDGRVGIGGMPDPSAILDIQSPNKGVLFPKVSLTSAVDNVTIPSPAEGLTVYNTSYAGSGSNIITPGLHYWDGSRWTRMNNKQLVLATWPSLITNDQLTTYPTFHYTGTSITLPPGKWLVCAAILINATSSATGGAILVDNEAVWVRSSFSESNTTFSISPDIIGAYLISGDQVGPSAFGICSGCIVIHNNTSLPKTYYYWASVEKFNTNKSPRNFGKRFWDEDQLYAIPLN